MNFKHIFSIALVSLLLFSCEKDIEPVVEPVTQASNQLTLVQEFENGEQTIEVYTKSGFFYTGYNEISIKLKENGSYVNDFTFSWMPIMSMMTMNHSCPKSTIQHKEGDWFQGYIVFQMTGMDSSGWNLEFTYTLDGVEYTVNEDIEVMQSARQNVTVFTGTDSVKYVMALIEPKHPEIAINEMVVGLYTMQSMMMFPKVENYTITLDPRMPSMDNHSSPNNTDLVFHPEDGFYRGDLSLTMTGYWVLNHKLINEEGEVLKGDDVTDTNLQSSLYLELEF